MKKKSLKKKPTQLTSREIWILKYIDEIFEVNEEESVSQTCMRFGCLPEDDLLFPVEKALFSFCKDNPKLDAIDFEQWYNELTDNEDVFRLDRVMLESIKDARQIFDKKIGDLTEKGLVSPDYDENFAFRAIIGKVVHKYYYLLHEKYITLNNDAFFKNKLFSKYKIIALEYEDDSTLDSFQNNKGYNRFDVEAILLYVTDRYDLWEERLGKIQDIYNKVKEIVYEDKNRKLSETKAILERTAKSSEQKFQYAFFYAAAVIEWHLRNH